MRTFRASEIRRFLEAVNRHLDREEPLRLLVVGGAAAALGYGLDTPTKDIDTFQSGGTDLQSAAEKARKETDLPIPFGPAGIAELPYHHEDRLQRTMEELDRLVLFVPELHDLILSKLAAGREPDLEATAALRELHGLNPALLVERYVSEMRYAIGRVEDLDLKFLSGIERAFGEEAAREADQTLQSLRAARD